MGEETVVTIVGATGEGAVGAGDGAGGGKATLLNLFSIPLRSTSSNKVASMVAISAVFGLCTL